MSNSALEALARVAPGSAQEAGLSERLRQALQAAGPTGLAGALDAFAAALKTSGNGPRLVARLANAPDAATRRLALELATRLPLPLTSKLIAALRPLLLDRTLPLEVQLASAAAVLRSLPPDGAAADEVLQAVVAGLAKQRAIERLEQLEIRTGKLAALDALRKRIRAQIPMPCPRCRVRLPRVEMVRHLWLTHQLLLDGRNVREPGDVIADLVRAYAARREALLLMRCFDVAMNADPKGGAERVRGLLRAMHVREDVEKAVVEAGNEGACVCPRCHAAVPVPRDGPLRPLTASRGRLAGAGYVVEVSERGWEPHLEVATPQGALYRGPEEGVRWTPRTATLLLVGPPVLLAVLVGAALNLVGVSGVIPVLLLLWLAALAALFLRVRAVFTGAPADRAVDHAWQLLVPRLHTGGFDATAADFLAGLALSSIGRGRGEERSASLQNLLALTDKALSTGVATPGHLAALWRLAAEDAAALGSDPVHAVARQISRALEGGLPLAFADRLLEHWESPWWHTGNLTRLRALVCDRAFEAGFRVADLQAIGRSAPALGEVLRADDAEGLARLRSLWLVLAEKPWSVVAPAQTIFELAVQPTRGGRPLALRPDLLLLPTLPESGPERRFGSLIELCAGGVRFGGTLLTENPRVIEVKARVGPGAGGYDLIVGPYQFAFQENPETLVWRLERWCQYYFTEFVPRVDRGGERSAAVAERLRGREAVRCAECGERFLAAVGEVGVALG